MTDIDITHHEFNAPAQGPAQSIKVIGVGGGGNNAVAHMFNRGIKDVSFVQINTDKQVLTDSSVPTRLVIGPGRGAGGNPERAKKYAEESADAISEIFDDQTDMVFITAGMGGGTGTGAGPVVARMAKERGILTVGIVTVPFLFEGKRKILKALEGADEMAKNVDSLLVINNERLTEIYQDLDIFKAFAKADDTLLKATQSITDIITIRGIINRDFNDVDTTLREGGTAIISTGYGEGPNRVTAAIEDALHSPLLKDTDIFGSKKLLMVLYVSDNPEEHPFNMDETRELTSFIAGIDNEVDIMWGLYQAPDLDDKVKITILASGFEVTVATDPTKPTPEGAKPLKPTKPKHVNPIDPTTKKIKEMYKKGPVGTEGRVLNPDDYDNLDSEDLNDIERTPAAQRFGRQQFGGGIGRQFGRKFGSGNDNASHDSSRGSGHSNSILFDDIE
ncbi:MAG: cell division protein FtsZ [Muribaculaceae bacterium]|nr:cell division protein FtsZ [Muribaculaceae bacterium]